MQKKFGSPLTLAAITTVALTTAGVAWAEGLTRYVWNATTSAYKPVSGVAGTDVSKVELSNTENGVTGMSITEKYDNPCLIKITPGGLPGFNNEPDAKTSRELRGHCDGQEKSVTVGTGNYATAIQVCLSGATDSKDRRIKGVRLWGASVGADGKLTQNPTAASFELPNCKTWASKESCGADQIVTGISASYGTVETGSYSGIAIRCSSLTTSNARSR